MGGREGREGGVREMWEILTRRLIENNRNRERGRAKGANVGADGNLEHGVCAERLCWGDAQTPGPHLNRRRQDIGLPETEVVSSEEPLRDGHRFRVQELRLGSANENTCDLNIQSSFHFSFFPNEQRRTVGIF
jgi:hypothetical protein